MPSDESEVKKPKKLVAAVATEPVAIEELHQLIAHFESEIARAKAEIHNKQNLRGNAEALFND